MRMRVLALLLVVVMTTGLASCGTIPQEHRGAAAGTGIGAATGAAATAVFGQGASAIVAGTLVGALAGGVIGHYFYDKKRDTATTASYHGYTRDTNPQVKIEDSAVTPRTVRPGQQVDMTMTYAVLAPGSENINVVESRKITHNGQEVGEPQITVQREGGTYTSNIPLTLPSNAQPGTYYVALEVRSPQSSDVRYSSFQVR